MSWFILQLHENAAWQTEVPVNSWGFASPSRGIDVVGLKLTSAALKHQHLHDFNLNVVASTLRR